MFYKAVVIGSGLAIAVFVLLPPKASALNCPAGQSPTTTYIPNGQNYQKSFPIDTAAGCANSCRLPERGVWSANIHDTSVGDWKQFGDNLPAGTTLTNLTYRCDGDPGCKFDAFQLIPNGILGYPYTLQGWSRSQPVTLTVTGDFSIPQTVCR